MKRILFVAGLALSSSVSLAMPSPQYIPLDNLAQFGQYIGDGANMRILIDSTEELAAKAFPNEKVGFFVTKTVTINAYDGETEQGKKPFATLEMQSSKTCFREIFSTVKADMWGESRVLTFTLAPTIKCQK